MLKLKKIPKFKNEDQERKFWATHDTTEFFDTSQPLKVRLAQLKPSTTTVTVRMPESLLAGLKTLAHKKDVPYQSLMKIFLAEKVAEDLRPSFAQRH